MHVRQRSNIQGYGNFSCPSKGSVTELQQHNMLISHVHIPIAKTEGKKSLHLIPAVDDTVLLIH